MQHRKSAASRGKDALASIGVYHAPTGGCTRAVHLDVQLHVGAGATGCAGNAAALFAGTCEEEGAGSGMQYFDNGDWT